MDYREFFTNLEASGFEVLGKACAFRQLGEWTFGIIGLSGRFQQPDSKAYVICARPSCFDFMDRPNRVYSIKPMEYPFKITLQSFDKSLRYRSELFKTPYDRIAINGDWTELFKLLNEKLPDALQTLGVPGLLYQLQRLEKPGYIEKIWAKGNSNNFPGQIINSA